MKYVLYIIIMCTVVFLTACHSEVYYVVYAEGDYIIDTPKAIKRFLEERKREENKKYRNNRRYRSKRNIRNSNCNVSNDGIKYPDQKEIAKKEQVPFRTKPINSQTEMSEIMGTYRRWSKGLF